MNYTQTFLHWFTQNPLSAAAFIFGGGIVAVTLYTFVYDYTRLTHRDSVVSSPPLGHSPKPQQPRAS